MAFIGRETSLESGEPIFFYHFTLGLTEWRFCNYVEDVDNGGHTWTAIAITHTGIKTSQELSKASCSVSLEPVVGMTDQYFGWAPEETMSVVIRRGHVDEAETRIIWTGRVAAHERDGASEKFALESIYTSMAKNGLRQHMQLACRYGLYHRGCTVDKTSYETAGSISAINGLTLTVAAASGQADTYYSGGLITLPDGSIRTIAEHTGDSLLLTQPVRYLVDNAPPIACSIYPGCDKTRQTCTTRFSNLDNFGGFPWIPGRNPLGGTSIV